MQNKRLSAEQIVVIEERASLATPGPWTRNKPEKDADGWAQGFAVAATYGRQMIYARLGGSYPSRDCDFIAAARTDVPDLIAHIRSLDAEIATLKIAEAYADKYAAANAKQATVIVAKDERIAELETELAQRTPWRIEHNLSRVLIPFVEKHFNMDSCPAGALADSIAYEVGQAVRKNLPDDAWIDLQFSEEFAAMKARIAELEHYTSTACHHGWHERCRRECKFCGMACRCACHKPEGAANAD